MQYLREKGGGTGALIRATGIPVWPEHFGNGREAAGVDQVVQCIGLLLPRTLRLIYGYFRCPGSRAASPDNTEPHLSPEYILQGMSCRSYCNTGPVFYVNCIGISLQYYRLMKRIMEKLQWRYVFANQW